MKKYGIRRNTATEEDAIEFLNLPAKGLYNDSIQFANTSYRSHLKSVILDAVLDLEKVIKGVFNCDILMKNADYALLQKMFPNGTKMFGANTQEDVSKIGRFFETLRNISAHASACKQDFKLFRNEYSYLKNEKRLNSSVVYENNGFLTIAGLLFIVLNFLRQQSIDITVKQDNIVGIVACGSRNETCNTSRFIDEISHTNLEIPIRTILGTDVISAICGNETYHLDDNGVFSIKIGAEKNPTFVVNGNYNDQILTINGGSLTKTYYKYYYTLSIKEEDLFIELANKFPCMCFVDLLYLLKIDVFDKNTYDSILKDFDLYSKLNYPKFYVDKTVSILLLPKTNSDYRVTSSVTAGAVIGVMNNFEDYLVRITGIDSDDEYSRTSLLLSKIGFSKAEKNDIVILRNMAMHGYSFGDYILSSGVAYEFTLNFAISTLKNTIVYLKQKNSDAHQVFSRLVSRYFISRLISTKYKKAIQTSHSFLQFGLTKQIRDDLEKKNDFINNSFYDFSILNELNELCGNGPQINRVKLNGLKDYLYFFANNEDENREIEKSIKSLGLQIKKKENHGIILDTELSD